MYKAYLLLLTMLFLLISGCATTSVTGDITVDVNHLQGTDFTAYKTFGWIGSSLIINDPEGKWQLPKFPMASDIKEAIEIELLKRGIAKVTKEEPDMYVFYGIGAETAPKGNTTEEIQHKKELMKNIPKGTLGVALIDAGNGKPVWNGIASGKLMEKPSKEIFTERLNYVIKEMLKDSVINR